MNGHEVWYIVPSGVKVVDLKYRETGYDTECFGTFECGTRSSTSFGNARPERFTSPCARHLHYCPDRQCAQWWGDEVNELGEAFYALSPSGQLLARKGILELVNWQEANGVIYSPVLVREPCDRLPLQMLASVGRYGFHTQYWFSGDSTFVAEVILKVERYLLGSGLWELRTTVF